MIIKLLQENLLINMNGIKHEQKLLVFGSDQQGPDFLIDQTKAVQYLNEIRDSMCISNLKLQKVLAEDDLKGVRFGIQDVELHNDAIHRGVGQIIPT